MRRAACPVCVHTHKCAQGCLCPCARVWGGGGAPVVMCTPLCVCKPVQGWLCARALLRAHVCACTPAFVHVCVVTQSHPLLVGLCGVGDMGWIRSRWDLQRCHCSSALRCPTAGCLLGVGGGDAPSATPALQVVLFARKLLLVFAAWARATRCGQRCGTLAMTPSPPRTCLAPVLSSHIT